MNKETKFHNRFRVTITNWTFLIQFKRFKSGLPQGVPSLVEAVYYYKIICYLWYTMLFNISGQLLNASAALRRAGADGAASARCTAGSAGCEGACSVPYNWVSARSRAIRVLSASQALRLATAFRNRTNSALTSRQWSVFLDVSVLWLLSLLLLWAGQKLKMMFFPWPRKSNF